jgi:hypothetical protein
MIRILDEQGEEQTQEWLEQEFGQVEVVQPKTKPAYFLVQLREQLGPSNIDVFCHPHDRRRRIAFFWPDAPTETSPYEPEIVAFYQYPDEGTAKVGFALGPGSYYWPSLGQVGPHTIWIEEIDETFEILRSAYVRGLGMLGDTNHRHLNLTFKWIEAEPLTIEEQVLQDAEELRNQMRLPMPLYFAGPAILAAHGFAQAAGFDHFEDSVTEQMIWWQMGFDPEHRMAIVYGPESDYNRWTLLIYRCEWDENNQLVRTLVSRKENP